METKRLILILIAIALLGGIIYSCSHEQGVVVLPNKKVAVNFIRVISGHEFDIALVDGRRINAMLLVATPTGPGSNVSKKVTDLINASSNPNVVLIRKEENFNRATIWRIELYLTTKEGREIKLSQWLKDNKLLWE